MAGSEIGPPGQTTSTALFSAGDPDPRAPSAASSPPAPPPPPVAAPDGGYMGSTEAQSSMSPEGSARFAFGLFLLIGGLVVTGGSYLLAGPGQGFTLAYGAIGVGIWKMVTGLSSRA
jgi:hypothetical protein